MKYNDLVQHLCRHGLSPDEAESMCRSNFRHALSVLSRMDAIDRKRKTALAPTDRNGIEQGKLQFS